MFICNGLIEGILSCKEIVLLWLLRSCPHVVFCYTSQHEIMFIISPRLHRSRKRCKGFTCIDVYLASCSTHASCNGQLR